MKSLFFLFILSSMAIMGCSSSDGGGTSASTTVSTAMSNVDTQISNLIPDTSGLSATALLTRAAMTTEWTTTGNTHTLGGDFGASPRDFVRIMGNEGAQSSLMYRLNQIMDNVCIFNVALPDTDNNGLPDLTDGSTVTLTAAVKANMVSECGVSSSNLPADDEVVGYQVQETESGSDYEYIVGFDMNGGTSYASFFFFTINSSLNRIGYSETSAAGGNSSVALFEYNPTSNIFLFEFSEFAPSTFEAHYRGVLNASTGIGRFVAGVSDLTDTSQAVVSVLEGGGDELHVSYSFDGSSAVTDGSACIDSSDFSVATDASESCNSGQITGALASAFTYDWQTTVNQAWVDSRGVTSNIQFTGITDILTANAAE